MALETLDRRVALEEAFDSAEADAKGEVYTPPVREETTPEPQENETPDPGVVESKATEQPKPKDRPRTRGVPLDERGKPADAVQPEGKTPESTPKAASNLDKAPLGWGVQRDTLWAKTPPDVRAAIDKREREIQHGMSQAGTVRKIAEEYHQVIMPFENIIKHMNTTPREAITNVMQTATALIVGTQEQKCAVLTEMIQRYGVDVVAFDKVLTAALQKGDGKLAYIGGNPAPNTQPLDPRLKPLFAMEERLRNSEIQRQEGLKREAAEIVTKLQDKPYFDDVRDDMADIMEISAKRGYVMTVEEAYTKATQLHPEVSKLIVKTPTQRTPSDALARARKASSTVRGAPGGPVSGAKADRRAQLEAAWDSQ